MKDCPANSALKHDCEPSLCTHGEGGRDGRGKIKRLQKAALARDLQLGEVTINE